MCVTRKEFVYKMYNILLLFGKFIRIDLVSN